MISFYPGPSRVYTQVRQYLIDAYDHHIVSINHRSDSFMSIYQRCAQLFKTKLAVPDNYSIYFTSSATECWEIIAQSFIKKNSAYFFNGPFGEKGFQYAKKIKSDALGIPFDMEKEIPISLLKSEVEVIGITQNETSNGTFIDNYLIEELKEKYPSSLLAIDITSSIGGTNVPISYGDIWYGSVQKCLGLPSGLGIMICSPQAMQKAKEVNDQNFYNSIFFMDENRKKWQTHYTPNVLGIYLLMRVLEQVESIEIIDKKINERARKWNEVLSSLNKITPLIADKKVASSTVFVMKGEEKIINEIKKKAYENKLILGNGYGPWKNISFRIANFPALEEDEIEKLKQFFLTFYSK